MKTAEEIWGLRSGKGKNGPCSGGQTPLTERAISSANEEEEEEEVSGHPPYTAGLVGAVGTQAENTREPLSFLFRTRVKNQRAYIRGTGLCSGRDKTKQNKKSGLRQAYPPHCFPQKNKTTVFLTITIWPSGEAALIPPSESDEALVLAVGPTPLSDECAFVALAEAPEPPSSCAPTPLVALGTPLLLAGTPLLLAGTPLLPADAPPSTDEGARPISAAHLRPYAGSNASSVGTAAAAGGSLLAAAGFPDPVLSPPSWRSMGERSGDSMFSGRFEKVFPAPAPAPPSPSPAGDPILTPGENEKNAPPPPSRDPSSLL